MSKSATLIWAIYTVFFGCSYRPKQHRDPSARAVVQITPTGSVVLPPPYDTPFTRNHAIVGPRPPGAALHVPPGFRVHEFAAQLGDARALALAPNGDIFVAESAENRITILRDTNHDGIADERHVFATGLHQPFGMAFHTTGWFYVANTDEVVRFAYTPGQLEAHGTPQHIASVPAGGYNYHWTRTIAFSPDETRLFVSIGSETNVSPEADPLRASITDYALDGHEHHVYANGVRNAVGIAFEPTTHALYAAVNERDELGDDLVPDYFSEIHQGAFYGWPYSYFGQHEDPRRAGERPDLVARAVVPDLSLGAHVAPVGLVFYGGTMFPPEYRGDAYVSMHGSWNRAHRNGYKVVRVRFQNGRPTGQVEDFLSGWLTADELIWGRPVGLLVAADGALLVCDDATRKIWRVAFGPT